MEKIAYSESTMKNTKNMRKIRKNTKIKAHSTKISRDKKGNKIGVIPLNDRVLVKPLGEEMTKTASGIIIPDTVSKEKPEQGEVVAVGEGRWLDGKRVPVSVKVGDKIVFSRYGYEDVKIKEVEYYILKEENILAIIK